MQPLKPRRIIFTVYDGVSLLDLAGPLEAFRIADAFSSSRGRRASYECTVVSSRGGRVMTAAGLHLHPTPARKPAKHPTHTFAAPGRLLAADVPHPRTPLTPLAPPT